MDRVRIALVALALTLLLASGSSPAAEQADPIELAAATSATPSANGVLTRRLHSPTEPVPRIVNGVRVGGLYPTVGMLGRTDFGFLCSGTLIGCRTFLTAGHCVLNPATPALHFVFLQHVGFVGVSSITRNPDFAFGVRSDEAVIELSSPVSGIAPSVINSVAEPPLGTLGDIVGFGSVGEIFGPGTSSFGSGIKRRGDVVTAGCTTVPESSNLCWNFTAPVGPPGTDSNTCKGDSGGPLFADIEGLGDAVAGVTSGGNSTCMPTDSAFDADVHFDHEWIESVAGDDLAPISCGSTPPVLGPDAEVLFDRDTMKAEDGGVVYQLEVAAGRSELRVTTNGELAPFQNYDLYVKHDGEPSIEPPDYDCSSVRSRSFEACVFPAPAAGTWTVLIANPAGHQGEYDLTVSILGGPVPDPCSLLDADGDGEMEPLTDGVLVIRHLFGFQGGALTAGALGDGATRDAEEIDAFLGQCTAALDVDGDGSAAPLTDGLLFLRYLFGLRGTVLTIGAVGEGCSRCDAAAIEPVLAALSV